MARNLWDAFSGTVSRGPERVAIAQGSVLFTYGQWMQRALQFADRYAREGVGYGDRVLAGVVNDPDMAAAIVGAWAVGAIVSIIDAASPASHLTHALDKVSPSLLLHDASVAPAHRPSNLPVLATSDVAADVAAGVERLERRAPSLPTDPASIVFTSGSTGRPKGVTQSHGNLFRGCATVAGYLGLRDDDRILCPVPWSFDYGYGQLLSCVLRGVPLVLPVKPNPFSVCEAITMHRPTVLAGVPSLYTYLVRGVSPIRQTDGSSIRLLTNSGGRIPGPVLAEIRQVFSAARVSLNYGLTETYRSCTLAPELVDAKADSIGKPIPGVDIVVVREDGSLAETGEEGELVHRGDFICLGYWGDAEATQRAVRPDPLAPPGCPNPPRALYTGDFGYRDADGFFHYRCRRDAQLKSMGVRVSPLEVEELLYESGLVREVAVFGVPHEMLGDEIWAVVVPIDDRAGLRESLVAHARKTLSAYMLPRRFVYKESLPRTATQKVDYPALRSEAIASTQRPAPATRP